MMKYLISDALFYNVYYKMLSNKIRPKGVKKEGNIMNFLFPKFPHKITFQSCNW